MQHRKCWKPKITMTSSCSTTMENLRTRFSKLWRNYVTKGMRSKPRVVVIAGPVGVGKNSIIEGIIKRYKNCVDLITATTRAPLPGEKDRVDYFFMSEDAFDAEIAKGNVLEVSHHPAGFR